MKDSIDTNGIVIGRNTVREALKSERSVDAVYVARRTGAYASC